MQATIVKVAVEDGQQVVKGDLVVVLEAMKMEQPIQAHKDGVIGAINADRRHDRLGRSPAPDDLLTRRHDARSRPARRAVSRRSVARSTMCIARAASVMLPDSDG